MPKPDYVKTSKSNKQLGISWGRLKAIFKYITLGIILSIILFVSAPYYANRLDPKDAASWGNKGNVLYSQGKYDEAIKAYDKAIEINPQYSEAWNNKGNAFYAQGKYDEAVRAYDKAIEIDYPPGIPPGLGVEFGGDVDDTEYEKEVKRVKHELANGHIAYSNYTTMEIDKIKEFEARIAINATTENLTKGFATSSDVAVGELKAYTLMYVNLTGDEFGIVSRSSEIQELPEMVPGHEYGQWLWNIRPKKEGIHNLTLVAYAVIKFPDWPERHMLLETKRISINVTVKDSLEEIFSRLNKDDLKWLATAIIIPLLVWGWNRHEGKQKPKKDLRKKAKAKEK